MGVEHLHDTAPTVEVTAPVRDVEAPAPLAPIALPAGGLVVGHAEDAAEHDADRRADRAIARLRRRTDTADDGVAADAHRHGPGCSHLRRSATQSEQAVVGREGGPLDTSTSARIESLRGSGTALPDGVRSRMEGAFGSSFEGVRIHTGAQAAGLNRLVSARAFTTGNDIFFGAGEYAPHTPDGERTLAHELAHTLQPGGGSMHRLFGSDDPAKKNEKDRKKQLKHAKEVAVREAKKLESAEAAKLKAERAKGSAHREGLKGTVSDEITEKGKVEGSATLKSIQKRFEVALIEEALLAEFTRLQGIDADDAAEAAYEVIWLETADKDLRAVRPPRETASERLAGEVRAARTEEGATAHKRGELLPEDVEYVYEAWEVKTRELMKGTPPLPYLAASAMAEQLVWNAADPDVRKQRPADKGVERQAQQMAKVRTKNGTDAPAAVTSLLEKADATTDGGAVDKVFGVVGAVGSGAKKLTGKIGSGQDDALQANTPKAFESSDPSSSLPGPVGKFSQSIEIAQHAKATGTSDTTKFVGKDTKGNDLPTSVTTEAAKGMGKVTSIFGDLLAGAQTAIKMVKAIQAANEERDTVKILAATKTTADCAGAMGTLGKDTANLAAFIDAGVAQSVASVIPGFNIAIAVMSLVSNVMGLATTGLHLSHSNDSLTDARIRKPGAKSVDVLVAPLLHVTAGLTKSFEQTVWSTTQAVSSLVTSIATVATAGGFGIPAAVDAGMKVLDLLHKLGHTIADNVLAVLAQRSREASVAALEGAAEGQFRHDPAMAVDGIVMKAKKGDPVAVKFLEAYGFPPDKIAAAKLSDVRSAVLDEMGSDADPKTTYQSYKAKVGNMLTKWKETGELAETRNEDGKGRGFFWRVKMTLLRGDDAHTRSKNKTYAKTKYVVCRVGSLVLYADAVKEEKEAFLNALEKVDALTIQKASEDPKNSEEWQKILGDAWKDMLAKGIKGKPLGAKP